MKSSILAFLIAVPFVAGIVLGVYWLIWKLWIYLADSFFPGSTSPFAHPSFWAFAALWFFVMLVGRQIFSSGSKD